MNQIPQLGQNGFVPNSKNKLPAIFKFLILAGLIVGMKWAIGRLEKSQKQFEKQLSAPSPPKTQLQLNQPTSNGWLQQEINNRKWIPVQPFRFSNRQSGFST